MKCSYMGSAKSKVIIFIIIHVLQLHFITSVQNNIQFVYIILIFYDMV